MMNLFRWFSMKIIQNKTYKKLLLIINDVNKNNDTANRIKNYVLYVVSSQCDFKFIKNYIFVRPTFQVVAEWLQSKLKNNDFIPIKFKLYAVLWILGNQESFFGVSDRFRNCTLYIFRNM